MIQVAAVSILTKILIFVSSFLVIFAAGFLAVTMLIGKGLMSLYRAIFSKGEAATDKPAGEVKETKEDEK